MRSDEPNLKQLPPSLQKMVQESHFSFRVRKWKVEFESTGLLNGQIREIKKLCFSVDIPFELKNLCASLEIRMAAIIDESENDPNSASSWPIQNFPDSPLGRILKFGDSHIEIQLVYSISALDSILSSLYQLGTEKAIIVRIAGAEDFSELSSERIYIPVKQRSVHFMTEDSE